MRRSLNSLFHPHPHEEELRLIILSKLPEGVRDKLHIWAEANGRIHIHPRGLGPSQWWRVHSCIQSLGGYWRSEDWPDLPCWVVPAWKALGLLEGGG